MTAIWLIVLVGLWLLLDAPWGAEVFSLAAVVHWALGRRRWVMPRC